MFTPFTIWLGFSLAVLAFCWFKPHAARIFMGCFFIVMAVGVNVVATLINPEIYLGFAQTTFIPFYRWVVENVVALSPAIFGLLVAAFEIAVALLMLSKGRYVKLGLGLAIAFQLAIMPLAVETLPCVVFALALAALLRKDYDRSLLDMLRARFAGPLQPLPPQNR